MYGGNANMWILSIFNYNRKISIKTAKTNENLCGVFPP